MKKVRWLYSDWGLPLSELSSKMLGFQYDEERTLGYILSKSTNKLIIGKFIEKKVLPVKVVDPFGNIKTNSRTIYNITNFIIKDDLVGLELINPPRGIKPFINNLHKITGLGLVISEIDIDPLKWLEDIENSHKCTVNSILASGIKEEKNGIAKISMSGINDIRNEFSTFIGNRDHNIDSVKLSLVLDNEVYKLELYKNSVSKIPLEKFEEIKNIVEASYLSTYYNS